MILWAGYEKIEDVWEQYWDVRDRGEWEWRKLHNEELHGVHCLSNIITVIKSSKMRWVKHIAHMTDGSFIQSFSQKTWSEGPFGRRRYIWVDDIKVCPEEQVCEDVEWMQLVQDRAVCRFTGTCQPSGATRETEFPEWLSQLRLLQDGVNNSNKCRMISCGHSSLSAVLVTKCDARRSVSTCHSFLHQVYLVSFCNLFIFPSYAYVTWWTSNIGMLLPLIHRMWHGAVSGECQVFVSALSRPTQSPWTKVLEG
jgi:hypothetical protein